HPARSTGSPSTTLFRSRDLRLGEQPGEGQVDEFLAALLRERRQVLDEVEVRLGQVLLPARVARDARALRQRAAAAVLAGEQPAEEREVGEERQPALPAGGQDVLLGVAAEQAELVLHAHEARRAGGDGRLGL